MKNGILFFICLTLNILVTQNDTISKTPFTKMYLQVWQEAVEHCIHVAKAMPEEKHKYKPTEFSKTFVEQMVHIAAANKLLTQRCVQGMEVKPNTPDASQMTKAEILEMLCLHKANNHDC